ncbi:MAG TPA: hypothetical protein H9871_13405 [Candidatus Nesterenkonia stercoripullorum]|uniref:Uncharacterized protein n=1 Tax=Candidatus Nesterenkonia stercoripullorum TaxID=2838701 RepID=A0A9D1UVG7_9MICC|nr:hypothetical protein [Candidatus Nesterenkonia stercoripullorum]
MSSTCQRYQEGTENGLADHIHPRRSNQTLAPLHPRRDLGELDGLPTIG